MKYIKADSAIREHRNKKIEISKELHGLGFHAAIEKMYLSGIGPTAIARKYCERWNVQLLR